MTACVTMAMWVTMVAVFIPTTSALKLHGDLSGMSCLERSLFHNLTEGYNSISRPVARANDIVQLKFGLSLNQILDLDEKHQILSSYVWIYETWVDSNLVWRPEDYHGLDRVMFPASTIWLPDVYIYNVAGSALEGFVNVSGSNVVVLADGHVSWSIPLHIKSACPVDATFFPYDKQQCDVHFGSWIYDISQMDITLLSQEPDISNYVVNNEFDLYQTKLSRDIVNNTCCPGEGQHPMVHLRLFLQRKTNYYDYIVIAPTINLCVLTLATFLLPCECGWKIAIGLTVFLTLYVLQLLIAENVPDTNSTPLISVFLLLVMSLNSISLIMATIIMNIKRRSLGHPPPRVPKLLLYVCENYLSKIVCTRMSEWERIANTPKYIDKRVQIFPPRDDIHIYDSDDNESNERYVQLHDCTSDASTSSTDKQSSEQKNDSEAFDRTETAESTFSFASVNDTFVSDIPDTSPENNAQQSRSSSSTPTNNTSGLRHENRYTFEIDDGICAVTSETTFDDSSAETLPLQSRRLVSRNRLSYRKAMKTGHSVNIRQRERTIHKGKRSAMSKISRKYQWYFVADVIDTTAFVVYLIVMIVSIITVLVIRPMYA